MNSMPALFILSAVLSWFNCPSTKAIAPENLNQSVTPALKKSPDRKPVWVDKHNGRRYPLPATIDGKPVSFYLKSPKVSPLAKAFYTSRFRPTDNDSTTQLLALVTTTNQAIRPFYRWCLDFTITISDGALGEYPGDPALAYATKFPQEFFAYMDKDNSGERYKKWVEIIAYSGMGDYNGTRSATKKIIIGKMKKSRPTCNDKTSQRISVFANDITQFQTKRW